MDDKELEEICLSVAKRVHARFRYTKQLELFELQNCAFIALLERFSTGQFTPETSHSQIEKTAYLYALKYAFKTTQKRKEVEHRDVATLFSSRQEPSSRAEDFIDLHNAIEQLNEQERRLLFEYFIRDETLAAIASSIGITANAVGSRLNKVLTKLRAILC